MAAKPAEATILVADDDAELLGLVVRRLSGLGWRVIEAFDGEKAWQMVRRERPDLVILDVMMPGMSGWEVCRHIRDAEDLSRVGVIMLTGIGQRLNEMTSPLYGADAYLDKPFELDVLERTVRQVLAARRGAPADHSSSST